MNRHIRSFRPALLAAAMAFAFVAPVMAQGQGRLLPAQDGDLVATRAVAVSRAASAEMERAPVRFFHELPADDPVLGRHEPFEAASREYWQQLDGSQLREGYALALTAPGAVVMISPGVKARPLHRDQLSIASAGRSHDADSATQTLADAAALRQAGMDVTPGTLAFKLRPGFEADARIQVAGAEGRYVLHVLEPESRDVLRARASVDTVHAGGEVKVRFALDGGARIDGIHALLVAPDGQAHDLEFAPAHGKGANERVGSVRAPVDFTPRPGLWEVRATVAGNDGGRAFQRDVRTAVAVVVPTARLDGAASVDVMRRGGMDMGLGVEVATPGRYEVRGVLFATGQDGKEVPVGIAYAADWLAAGRHTLTLNWPEHVLGKFSPPYVLRDLRLTDQSSVAVLERRAEALRVD